MITYQEYNTRSPLKGLVAKWTAQNVHLLAIDPRPVAPPLKGAVSAEAPPAEEVRPVESEVLSVEDVPLRAPTRGLERL